MEAKNFEYNASRNGNESLTVEAAYILRHIMHEHTIPLCILPSLWAMFYFLLFRKPITADKLAGQTQLWNHIHRIHLIDQKIQTRQFQRNIVQMTEHGFTQYFNMSSDGSIHHNVNRNVLLITCNASDDPTVLEPSFRLLTCSASPVKTSEFGAAKNVQ